ncbi:DUF2259 domain-containing protein [Roseibium sp.]|uniref:DUF2259 domain-containing protein n=1 Tax=Roseibium sp. TaxID=1936156 RepID=UPI003D0998F5
MSVIPSRLAKLPRIATRSFATFLAILWFAPIAQAADTADLQVLGFSRDGTTFAFEQYGIQDGSGFPYSEIFVVDVIGDTWVAPSPFRFRTDAEAGLGEQGDRALAATRAENRSAAQPLLQARAIAGKGRIVGMNPPTELGSDPHRMNVAPRLPFLSGDEPFELALSEYPLPGGRCESYGADTKGFRLTMVRGGVTRLLNDDKSLPNSRNCPLGYRIERVLTHFPDDAPPVFAILIQMESFGFEGADRRYLAITGRL